MYIYNIEIKGRKYDFISKNKNRKSDLVEKYLKVDDYPEFYDDQMKFIDNYCKLHIREAVKNLYYITTNQRGYDTYDSAVYCAYSESHAIELSEKDMSAYKKYSNLARIIGIAEPHLKIGVVISSFNAG
jgi:hypothetical protein